MRTLQSVVRGMVRGVLSMVGIKAPRGKLMFLKRGLHYRHILGYFQIPGWLPIDEALTLFDLALTLPNNHPVIVEIGSWQGKSALLLAKGIKDKSNPVLYCIDPFNADGDLQSKELYSGAPATLGRSLQEQFIKNMKNNEVDDLIKILVGYSFDFAADFPEKIDFLFIDGNHDYDVVLRDYRNWSPLLKVGGIIAFHDVFYDPVGDQSLGPGLVVKQYILGSPKWSEVNSIDSLLIARKVTD